MSPPAAEISALFSPLAGRRAVLAVSGGPDSVALMCLAAQWLMQEAPEGTALFVATVDHGLRPESRSEAETVGRWAAALGLPHQTLHWQGEKPKSRIQERARAARYALLRAYARQVGADYLLTAHHADDQAETILFRLMRGSGIAGLAGMQSRTKLGSVTLYRPLLNLPKKTLVACCESCGQPYFNDPSNRNSAFARTRLRAILPLFDDAGLDAAGWARLGRRAASVETALVAVVAQARAELKKIPVNEGFSIALADLRALPEEILRRVVTAEVGALGTGARLRLERLESLTQDLYAALQTETVWHRTLGGVKLSIGTDGFLTLTHEKARRRGKGQNSAVSAACDTVTESARL